MPVAPPQRVAKAAARLEAKVQQALDKDQASENDAPDFESLVDTLEVSDSDEAAKKEEEERASGTDAFGVKELFPTSGLFSGEGADLEGPCGQGVPGSQLCGAGEVDPEHPSRNAKAKRERKKPRQQKNRQKEREEQELLESAQLAAVTAKAELDEAAELTKRLVSKCGEGEAFASFFEGRIYFNIGGFANTPRAAQEVKRDRLRICL